MSIDKRCEPCKEFNFVSEKEEGKKYCGVEVQLDCPYQRNGTFDTRIMIREGENFYFQCDYDREVPIIPKLDLEGQVKSLEDVCTLKGMEHPLVYLISQGFKPVTEINEAICLFCDEKQSFKDGDYIPFKRNKLIIGEGKIVSVHPIYKKNGL